MKPYVLHLIFFLLCISQVKAQFKEKIPIQISAYNNGTSLPGKFFSIPIHPGICIGTSIILKQKEKSVFFQNIKVGYFYHRYAQHGIQLYTETGYRFNIYKNIKAEAMIGPGYLHSFAAVDQFVLKDGQYVKKKNWGRPQFMISTALGLVYQFPNERNSIFLTYQFWLQTPFVKKYVPLLPNTSLHLGYRFYINRKAQ